MQRYIILRLGQGLLSILALSVIVFVLARLAGDPRSLLLGDYYTPEDWDALGRLWGLDRPLAVQYGVFLKNLVTGDFGTSVYWREPVTDMVMARLPATMQLGGAALSVGILIAIPMGVMTAVKRDTWVDVIGKAVAMVGQSAPSFWLAIVFIWVFAVKLQLLPTSGREGLEYYVLPVATLGLGIVAGLLRITRSAMLDVLDTDYIKLARIKGVPEWKVVWNHALRNAAIPIVTYLGLILVSVLTGFVVVETVFSWPGMGLLAITAINRHDYAVTQAIVMMGGTFFVLINLIIDVGYGYLDPRIRLR